MPDYAVSLTTTRTFRSGFQKQIEVTNTGTEPLTDFYVDITTTANIGKIWGGSILDLGGGTYRLYFNDTSIAPGETVTLSFKATGSDDVDLVPVPDTDPFLIIVDTSITAAEIQALIDTAETGTTIQLEAGTYVLDATISLDRDGITLVGAGSDQTIIDASALTQEAFAVGDGTLSGGFTLASGAAEGSTVIELSGVHSFEVGDYVYLERESTEAFYDEIGDQTWRKTDVPLRTSIVEVVAVDGNTLTLATGVHFDFDTVETTVFEIALVEDVTLGGFSIDYGLGTADPSNFENTLPEFDRDAVIQVDGTAGLTIYDVTAHDVPSLGINFARSTNVSADDIEITGAHNKGAGGNGYAIQIRDVYDSSFTNLSDLDMRHSVVFASWTSSVGNFVHVQSTDRDINFHGGRDHDNTVLVDQSIRDAESDIIAPILFVNTNGTHYGSVTDADANTAKFGYVVGSKRDDLIEGYDYGAWLDGQAGDDTLIGGAVNDVLIGGAGSNVIDGGGGEDIVVYDASSTNYSVTDSGGVYTVQHVVAGGAGDTLVNAEWILFSDAALRLSDMAYFDRSTLDGIYTGTGVYDPATGTYTSDGGPTLDTSDPEQLVLYGTDGNDVFDVDQVGTIVWGLGNWDVVRSSVDFVMMDDVEKLELVGTGAINGQGGENNNILTGTSATNILRGMGGNDRIWARGGDDLVDGGAGNDELYGGGGNDIIFGGSGLDTLTGDSGADVFRFVEIADSTPGQADWIMDFVSGVDVIDLSLIDADTTVEGDQAFVIGGSGPGALWIDEGVVLGDVDGDGIWDIEISVQLAGLYADDFIL